MYTLHYYIYNWNAMGSGGNTPSIYYNRLSFYTAVEYSVLAAVQKVHSIIVKMVDINVDHH